MQNIIANHRKVRYYIGEAMIPSAGGSFTITGVPFQPKAFIFYTTNASNSGDLSQTRALCGMGFDDGITRWGCQATEQDSLATSKAGRFSSNTYSLIGKDSFATTVQYEARVSAFTSDGATLTINTNPGVNRYFLFIAIGGPGVNVQVGVHTITAPGTGNQAFTGYRFRPDQLVFSSVMDPSIQVVRGDWRLSLGYSSGSGKNICIGSLISDNVGTMNSHRFGSDADCLLQYNTANTVEGRARVNSLDLNGFTLNRTVAFTGSSPYFGVLAIAGPEGDVSTYDEVASAPTDITDSSLSWKGLLHAEISPNRALNGDANDCTFSIGAALSSTSRFAIAISDDHGAGTSRCRTFKYLSKVAIRIQETTGALRADVDFKQFNANGYTVTQETAGSVGDIHAVMTITDSILNNY